jgi:hypothetical protein
MKMNKFEVGDIILDKDEGGSGVVTKIGEWIVIDWQGLGVFGTPIDIAEEAILDNSWVFLSTDQKNPSRGDIDLSKLTPPKHDIIKFERKTSVGKVYEKIIQDMENIS